MRRLSRRPEPRRPGLRRLACRAAAAAPLVLQAGSATAGAWTLPKGSGQAIVSGRYGEADRRFDAGGASQPSAPFAKADVSLYGEYGVADGWTAIVEGRVDGVASQGSVTPDAARFGLGALGARVRLWESGASVVSAELTARLSPKEPDALAAIPVEAEGEVRLLAGRSFALGAVPAFLDGQIAYRFGVPLEASTSGRGDEMRLDATLGVRLRPDWLLLAQSFNTAEAIAGRGAFARRSHKIQLSAVYDLSSAVSLQLGAIATVAGADAVGERGVMSAVWLRF